MPEPAVRHHIVEMLFGALMAMDPAKLAAVAETLDQVGITKAERDRVDELYLAAMLADGDYRDRQSEVWNVLIHRQWLSPPTWEQLFDDLPPDGPARLAELYDAMPDGARAEYDRRYGRPQLTD